jgi:light-regulated signal transduction histidine kinase (bacteriophytochrome)
MQGLIQDLLAYSRAGTNRNRQALEKVSAEDALETALMNLRIAIENSGAVITHDSLPAVTTDETQLTQVFQDLVRNAIKYHGAEAPRVHVSATRNGGNEWIFLVRDKGLGIDPQHFERIFIMFQRLHRRDEFEGTGTGLAILQEKCGAAGPLDMGRVATRKGLDLLLCLTGDRGEIMESIGADRNLSWFCWLKVAPEPRFQLPVRTRYGYQA